MSKQDNYCFKKEAAAEGVAEAETEIFHFLVDTLVVRHFVVRPDAWQVLSATFVFKQAVKRRTALS